MPVIESFLLTKKVELARQLQRAGKQVPVLGPIDEVLRQVRQSPSRFIAGADAHRANLEQQLMRLRRHLPVTAK